MSPDIGFTAIDVLPRLLSPITFSNVSYIPLYESLIFLTKGSGGRWPCGYVFTPVSFLRGGGVIGLNGC